MTGQQQIRDLIERWAAAVHDGDMTTVLADHAPGIVMEVSAAEVPPPREQCRPGRLSGERMSGSRPQL
jgi:ketosteroid isomerase-like protein